MFEGKDKGFRFFSQDLFVVGKARERVLARCAAGSDRAIKRLRALMLRRIQWMDAEGGAEKHQVRLLCRAAPRGETHKTLG